MPLEIELLIAAWDNAKKNLFVSEDMEIDAESGEIVAASSMNDERADLVVDIDELMTDLVAHYREYADADESLVEVDF